MAKRYYRREFLNPKRGAAIIEADGSSLTITGCESSVTLDFSTWDKKYDETEAKVDLLHEVISEYRRYIKRELKRRRKEDAAP